MCILPWRQGRGRVGDRLVGGQGTIATPKPIRTVGSYWPYAPTLFDYIRRAMPQNAPQSLSDEDVYAVSAYILNLNGLVPADATLDAKIAGAIKMPNRDHVRRRSAAGRETVNASWPIRFPHWLGTCLGRGAELAGRD